MPEHCVGAMLRRYALQTHELRHLLDGERLSSNACMRWLRLQTMRLRDNELPTVCTTDVPGA